MSKGQPEEVQWKTTFTLYPSLSHFRHFSSEMAPGTKLVLQPWGFWAKFKSKCPTSSLNPTLKWGEGERMSSQAWKARLPAFLTNNLSRHLINDQFLLTDFALIHFSPNPNMDTTLSAPTIQPTCCRQCRQEVCLGHKILTSKHHKEPAKTGSPTCCRHKIFHKEIVYQQPLKK